MHLVSHLPCLEARNSRPGAWGGLIPKPRAQHIRASKWGTGIWVESQRHSPKLGFIFYLGLWKSFLVTLLPQGDTPSSLSSTYFPTFHQLLSEIETVIFIWFLPVLLMNYQQWCGILLVMVLITKDFRSHFQLPVYVYFIKNVIDFRAIIVKSYFPIHF